MQNYKNLFYLKNAFKPLRVAIEILRILGDSNLLTDKGTVNFVWRMLKEHETLVMIEILECLTTNSIKPSNEVLEFVSQMCDRLFYSPSVSPSSWAPVDLNPDTPTSLKDEFFAAIINVTCEKIIQGDLKLKYEFTVLKKTGNKSQKSLKN